MVINVPFIMLVITVTTIKVAPSLASFCGQPVALSYFHARKTAREFSTEKRRSGLTIVLFKFS